MTNFNYTEREGRITSHLMSSIQDSNLLHRRRSVDPGYIHVLLLDSDPTSWKQACESLYEAGYTSMFFLFYFNLFYFILFYFFLTI